MIKEKHLKEMFELMTRMMEMMEEYQTFCKEHAGEDCSEKEKEIAEMIYALAEKVPHVPIEFPETINYEDTSCVEE